MKQLTFPQPLALKFKQNRRIIIKFLQKKKQQQQQKEQQQKQQNQNWLWDGEEIFFWILKLIT